MKEFYNYCYLVKDNLWPLSERNNSTYNHENGASILLLFRGGVMVSDNFPSPEEAVHLDDLRFFFSPFRPNMKIKSLKPYYKNSNNKLHDLSRTTAIASEIETWYPAIRICEEV
jgi:hypothetical protein